MQDMYWILGVKWHVSDQGNIMGVRSLDLCTDESLGFNGPRTEGLSI